MIVIPRAQVLDAVKESIAAGAGVVTIITAGFKEQDSEGAELERQIRDLCLQAGVRVLGPNCLGHLNRHTALNLSFGKKWPGQGSISFISQSGALCSAILDRAVERGFGLSKMISIGNKSDLSENEFIGALADDPETSVLVCYLESVTKGKEFVEIAEKASRKKPIIVFKAGVTASGSRAASSHTGSLAGADAAYNAAFKRCGIIRAHYYEQMLEYAIAFANQPLPKGRRVCVITNAGGPGIMTADAVELTDLTMATLEVQTMQQLTATLPHAASKKNPVDVLGDADPSRYASSLELVQKDANVEAFDLMMQNIRRKVPNAHITGTYLERMCPAVNREIIIGMTRDPQFGPMIMFGQGGILVEVLKDVTFALAPLSRDEALSMIRSIKTFPLLQGVRGQPGIDIDSLAHAICRVSKLVMDFPAIKELDINPFMAAAELTHSMAADARITLSTPTV